MFDKSDVSSCSLTLFIKYTIIHNTFIQISTWKGIVTKDPVANRKKYHTSESHRQAVDSYTAKRGRAARIERARQQKVTLALEICTTYCPGEPHSGHQHDPAELRAALEQPSGIILACGVTYARVLREKRRIEAQVKFTVEQSCYIQALKQLERRVFRDRQRYGDPAECLSCDTPLNDMRAVYCSNC